MSNKLMYSIFQMFYNYTARPVVCAYSKVHGLKRNVVFLTDFLHMKQSRHMWRYDLYDLVLSFSKV